MPKQESLFDGMEEHIWQDEWVGMPEFIQDDKEPIHTVVVAFESEGAMDAFGELVGRTITKRTKGFCYPLTPPHGLIYGT